MRYSTHAVFERGNLLVSERVGLGNDRDQVNLSVKSAHDFNVQRLERVAGWLNKVDTGVHTVVDNVHAIDLVLRIEVGIEALLNVLHDWSPRLIVVHKITKSGSVDYSQAETNAILFDVC